MLGSGAIARFLEDASVEAFQAWFGSASGGAVARV